MNKPASVIWLTGISGSGKSTLAAALSDHLSKTNQPHEILDGDAVRDFFENDLGYSRAERILNVKRIGFAAMLLAKHGIHAVVANIAPYYEVRDFLRKKIPGYFQVYVQASRQAVETRDVKGFYAKVKAGEMKNMVGVDDGYDVPRHPDVMVNTDEETVEQSLEKVLAAWRSWNVRN